MEKKQFYSPVLLGYDPGGDDPIGGEGSGNSPLNPTSLEIDPETDNPDEQ